MCAAKINLSKLRLAREEANLTLAEVAQQTGFKAAATISRFETGTRGVKAEYLMALSKLYEKPIEHFFD